MLKFRCGRCRQKIGVPESYAGRRVRCPRCQQAATVPFPGDSRPRKSEPALPPLAPAPVVSADSRPDLAAVFAEYMPAVADPLHASIEDLWEDRFPRGTDEPPEPPRPVEQGESVELSQTMEIPERVNAEVIELPPARPPRPARRSEDEVGQLLRDLAELDAADVEPSAAEASVPTSPAPTRPDRGSRRAALGCRALGIAGILLGLAAIAMCRASGTARFAAPVGAAGLLLALVGVALTAVLDAPGVTLAGIGALVAAGGIAVPVLGARGLLPLPGDRRIPVGGSAPVVNVSMSRGRGYVPATSPIVAGDVEVRIASARVVRPVVHDGSWNAVRSLGDKRLLISLELRNVAASGQVAYRTWGRSSAGDSARFLDGSGRVLREIDPSPLVAVGRVERSPAMLDAHGPPVGDVLLFEPPAEGSGDLKLELPGANVGRPGIIFRILIPAAMVRR